MNKLLKWIRWKTYIRWKNKWETFYLLKGKWSSGFGKLIFITDTIQGFFYVIAYYSLLKFIIFNGTLSDLQVNSVITRYFIESLSVMQNNTIYIWNIYFLVVFVYCLNVGFHSSRWSLFSEDKAILNNIIPNKLTPFYLFIESIVWNFRQFILRILSLGVVLGIVTEKSIIDLFLITGTLVLMYLFLCLSFATLHYISILYRSYLSNKFILAVQLISIKILSIFLGFLFLNKLFGWVQNVPFLSADFTSEQLENWMYDGLEMLEESLFFVIDNTWLPHNYVSSEIYNNSFFILLFLLTLGIILVTTTLVGFQKYLKFDGYRESLEETFLPILEIVHTKFIFLIKPFKKRNNYFKIVYRSPVTLNRMNHIGGDLLYWFTIGIFSGLLADADMTSKIHILIIYFLLYFHIYFYCDRFYNAFKGVLSLESERANSLLYLNAKNNLWYLLKRKMIVGFTYIASIVIFGDLAIFILAGIPFKIGLWIFVNHFISVLLFGIVVLIPDIYNARFDFFNIEQIDDYADKDFTSSVISLFTVGLLIPMLMLPCVLYLIDNITLPEVFILNAIVLLFMALAFYCVLFVLKKKVKKQTFIRR